MAAEGSVSPPVAGMQEDVHVTGRRILAILVDGVILSVVLIPVNAAARTAIIPVLIGIVLGLIYFTVMEGYLGQTVGKMLLGIKVIREDTEEVPGLGAATIRTLLRIVDGLFGYLVGFIAVMASAKRQRLGDMAAHTLVVRK
jgi:uncharacterized RDD family membrane protein YckC